MAAFFTNLELLASQNHFLAYFIIYLVTIFLGNISAFASFWLAFGGYLGRWGVLTLMAVLVVSDVTGDLLWYSLGLALRDTKFGNFLKNHIPRHAKMEKALHRNSSFWIFISKYLYAASFPVIFLVGWMRIDFKKFFRTSLFSIITWVPLLSLVSYGLISGLSPLGAVAAFKQLEKLFLISIALFVTVDFVIAKIVQKIFRSRLEEE